MDLSIVIVTYKSVNIIEQCLDSLSAHLTDLKFEVILVDNASGDGVDNLMAEKYPHHRFTANATNLGFAKAVNQGLTLCKGDVILVLNPDTWIKENIARPAIEILNSHPEIGILGPKILNSDGSTQKGVRQFPTLASSLVQNTFLRKLPFFKTITYQYNMRSFNYEKESFVDQVSGAAMFFKRTLLDKVGMLDERFFVFFEEVDFCKRVHLNNLKIKYNPNITMYHEGGASRKKCNNFAMIYRLESQIKYLRKYTPALIFYPYIFVFKTLFLTTLLCDCFFDSFIWVIKNAVPCVKKHSKVLNRNLKCDFRRFFIKHKLVHFIFKI